MIKNQTKLITVLGISAVLLVGAASTYAANASNTVTKQVNEVVHVQTTDKAPTPQEIEAVLQGEPTPSTIKVEGLFSKDGKPDYTADFFLNDEKLISLLKVSAQELKQELATGKSVVEIAASRNVSKKQLLDAIGKTQVDAQIQAENKGEVPKSSSPIEKDITRKVEQVIEHKTETPWSK
ncbi:hypothetical protein PAECIP111891_05337 [Paenibacillus allorhizoplanae]|uniref:Uncharacterized protein n=1 Tax=Paenibacillus allorhizoplanae TaxID=2905648 RepID=A0ABM9CU67_9BACL|nr:hypothetical protein [Paenibacillus allorhizoplanae]CAH1222408.1 hypothetical protein PAECIP111891_05337 [Paenibacillus allorhizoplanae]